eukprot:190582-Pleurochrysis_carterae.AAC.1
MRSCLHVPCASGSPCANADHCTIGKEPIWRSTVRLVQAWDASGRLACDRPVCDVKRRRARRKRERNR